MRERVVIDVEIQHGKPVISPNARACDANSRRSNGGMSFEELCREYDFTTADIHAAIQYAED